MLTEFRENAMEMDPNKLAKLHREAVQGLDSLRQQCGLSTAEGDITYHLQNSKFS